MMENLWNATTVKDWPEEEQPREKLRKHGVRYLTNAELLSILLRTGNREENVVQLSRNILMAAQSSLTQLARLTVEEIEFAHKGIGKAKAQSTVAALELGRRLQADQLPDRVLIKSSTDAYGILLPLMADLAHEEFWVLLIDRSGKLIAARKMSSGGQSATIVDVAVIMKTGLFNNAHYIIAAHNHPSGSLEPSAEDKRITERLKKAGEIIGIGVRDHLIISNHGYYSFADQNLL
jgi:DNA repair protein RadC